MSKDARRRRPAKRHAAPRAGDTLSTESREKTLRIAALVVIAILAAIPFALGKHFEFNSPGAFDSGAYVYSARHILEGARIGVDEKPSAQMGTLLVNMLGVGLFGFSETGPKLIQMLLQAAALVLMFVAMRKLFGTLPAGVGVIIASVYLSAPVIAKFGNVKEQHMIAFMILGMSCFVLYQLNGRWWCSVLAGAFLCFAPLFKETGVSAIGGVGLFVIAQPLLKHCSWNKTGTNILLLLAGAAAVILPISLWLAVSGSPINYYPYSFLYRPVVSALQGPKVAEVTEPVKSEEADTAVEQPAVEQSLFLRLMPAYVRDSWRIMTPEQRRQARVRVFRWYGVLILPITLAMGAIIIRIIRLILARVGKVKGEREIGYNRFVLLFAVWWLLDMTFVWISPRSYEQYYLPLNASAAMLGGYMIAVYCDKAKRAAFAPQWLAIGGVALIVMLFMSLDIFRGLARSAHSGVAYTNPRTKLPERQKGYAQKLREVSQRRKGLTQMPWEVLARYIKDNSTPDDGIYVWGWWPGIYVQAQRLSPAPKAFEGTMHTVAPSVLSERVAEILDAFKKRPPKFIVDSRKSHFPWDRPPLELWPQTRKGHLPNDQAAISQFDGMYMKALSEKISPEEARLYEWLTVWPPRRLLELAEPDEARRYEVMKPLRDYVMGNYRIVRSRSFGQHILFQRK